MNNETDPLNSNRFALLDKTNYAEKQNRTPKPPSIFLRGVRFSAIVKNLTELTGNNDFHIVPLRK